MTFLQVLQKTLTKTMIAGGLVVFTQLAANQAVQANEIMDPVFQVFKRSGISYTYRPEKNPNVTCAKVPLKFRNRSQVVCIGYELGSYRVGSVIYEYNSPNDFPPDMVFNILRLAAKTQFVAYNLSPRSLNTERQWVTVSLMLERDELDKMLEEAILITAVAGDMAEEGLIGGDTQ
ncbi:MAG: hypothetical protein HC860_12840 [Alkalinema sp. RU_4_3]|nr:hypothetical protein [Alkalinema sp. RU_4_3]